MLKNTITYSLKKQEMTELITLDLNKEASKGLFDLAKLSTHNLKVKNVLLEKTYDTLIEANLEILFDKTMYSGIGDYMVMNTQGLVKYTEKNKKDFHKLLTKLFNWENEIKDYMREDTEKYSISHKMSTRIDKEFHNLVNNKIKILIKYDSTDKKANTFMTNKYIELRKIIQEIRNLLQETKEIEKVYIEREVILQLSNCFDDLLNNREDYTILDVYKKTVVSKEDITMDDIYKIQDITKYNPRLINNNNYIETVSSLTKEIKGLEMLTGQLKNIHEKLEIVSYTHGNLDTYSVLNRRLLEGKEKINQLIEDRKEELEKEKKEHVQLLRETTNNNGTGKIK